MDDIDRKQLYETAWKHWGAEAQIDMMIEESSEFIQALLKARRTGCLYSYAVSEEFADTLICFEQIETHLKQIPSTNGTLWDLFNENKKVCKPSWYPNATINRQQFDDELIKRMVRLTLAFIKARELESIFSYEVFEEASKVSIAFDQFEQYLKTISVVENRSDCSVWDAVQTIKTAKLHRLKERLMESMVKKYPDAGDTIE